MSSRSYLLEDRNKLESEKVRLGIQAGEMFLAEWPMIERLAEHPARILEVGCGNAQYLSLIQRELPDSQTMGVDFNKNLLLDAEKNSPNSKFAFGDITSEDVLSSVLTAFAPNLVVMRLVAQHLLPEQVARVFRSIKNSIHSGAVFVCIDTNDEEATFFPPSSALSRLLEEKGIKQRMDGGDRNVGTRLKSLFIEAGFVEVVEERIIFKASEMGWDSWRGLFWPVVKAGAVRVPIQEAQVVVNQAESWIMDRTQLRDGEATFAMYIVSGK